MLCYVALCCAMNSFSGLQKSSSPLIYLNYEHVKLSLSVPLGRKQINT